MLTIGFGNMKPLLIALIVAMILPFMANAKTVYKKRSTLTCAHPVTGKPLVYTGAPHLFDSYPEYGYYRVKTAKSYIYLPSHLCMYEEDL